LTVLRKKKGKKRKLPWERGKRKKGDPCVFSLKRKKRNIIPEDGGGGEGRRGWTKNTERGKKKGRGRPQVLHTRGRGKKRNPVLARKGRETKNQKRGEGQKKKKPVRPSFPGRSLKKSSPTGGKKEGNEREGENNLMDAPGKGESPRSISGKVEKKKKKGGAPNEKEDPVLVCMAIEGKRKGEAGSNGVAGGERKRRKPVWGKRKKCLVFCRIFARPVTGEEAYLQGSMSMIKRGGERGGGD